MAITTIALAPLFLTLAWPKPWVDRFLIARLVFSVYGIGVLIFCIGATLGDQAYFGEVFRHQGAEIFRLSGEGTALLEFAFGSRLALTLLGLGLMLALSVMWYAFICVFWEKRQKCLSKVHSNSTNPVLNVFAQASVACVVFLVLVWFGRGFVLKSKPINLVDAYQLQFEEQAQLALNPMYVVFKSSTSSRFENKKWYAVPKKEEPLFANQAAMRSKFVRRHPQLNDRFKTKDGRQKNIVVFFLESWSYEYIDGLSGNEYGATPHLDQLIQSSSHWNEFYAAAQRLSLIHI